MLPLLFLVLQMPNLYAKASQNVIVAIIAQNSHSNVFNL